MSLIKTVENELKTLSRRDQIEFYQKFFRTLKGDICEGDKILAIQIPQLRKVLKKYINQLTLVDIAYFLESEYNEFRFFGQQFIKTKYYKSSNLDEKKKYLDHMKKYLESINHWNLVDGIADIFGDYAIETNDNNYLYTLHNSKSIWHKRIATVSQIKLIKLDKLDIAIEFVQDDIENKHEYIQKANGWILREIGKKDEKKLINFLKENISVMPSVTKSYATERIRKIYDMKTLFNKIK